MSGLFQADELKLLLRKPEGQFLEFKSLWDLNDGTRRVLDRRAVRDLIAEYVAAFANADGGTLVLGVNDDGTPSGHGYPSDVVDDFLAVPERRLRPSVRVVSQRLTVDDCELLLLQVPNSTEAVMVEGNGFPYRVADRVVREPQEAINARKQAYRRVGYEQQVRPDATSADLDLELAGRFLKNTALGGRRVENVLQEYGLLLEAADGLRVTNAALLLFGRRPFVRWHPRAGVRLFRVKGTERLHGAERNVEQIQPRLEPPLALLVDEAYRLVERHISKSEKLHNLFFRETPEYPTFAWQEALINAVAHRDYGDQGRETEVWFFDDRMEIWSPGDLLPPVTVAKLQNRERVHASRNPLLVRVLADVTLMREEGEGVPRMFDAMEQSFLRQPQFMLDGGTFRVTLFNEPAFEGAGTAWNVTVARLGLGLAQKRVLLACPDGFTNEDYRTLSGVDRDTAYQDIQQLVARGIATPAERRGRGAVYRPSPGLVESRRWLEQRLDVLVRHLQTEDGITNTGYRSLFGLSRHQALRELRRLVDEGILTLHGSRRGARYAAGKSLEPVLARK